MTGSTIVAEAVPGAASRRTSAVLLVGWSAFLSAFAYVVLVGGGYPGIGSVQLRLLSLAIIATGIAVWAVLSWRRPWWWPRTAIWPALLLPFGTLLATTTASSLPRLGIDYLAWAILLIALYLMLVRILAHPFVAPRIGLLAALLGLILTSVYVASVLSLWAEWWELVGRITMPMLRPAYAGLPLIGGPTVVPVVVVLLAAIAFAGLGWTTKGNRLVLVVLAFLTLTTVLLAGARGSWIGLAAAIVVTAAALLASDRDAIRRVREDRRAVRAIALVGALLGVAAIVLAPAAVERATGAGDGGRVYYINTALRMFEDSPLVGHGPGTWPALRIAFSQPGEPDIYVPHPHNMYALSLAETGLLGVAVGAIVVVTVLWLIAGAWRSGDTIRRRWAVMSLFVMAFLAIISVFDSYANLPAVLLLAAVPVAVLDGSSERGISDRLSRHPELTRHRIHRAVTVALFGACALAVIALIRVETIALTHQRAVAAIEEARWDEALAPAADAAAQDPGMVPYQLTYGQVTAATGEWGAAAGALEAAATADDVPESWLGLAQARLALGRPGSEILDAIERGRRLWSEDAYVALASAELYHRLDMREEATAALATVLARNPSLAADRAWQTDPMLALYRDEVYDSAMRMASEPWNLALMAGDVDGARRLAITSDDDLAPTIVEAWSGDADAVDELYANALRRPEAAQLVSWAARVAAKNGDAESAARFRRIIVFGLEGAALPGYELRIMSRDRSLVEGALSAVHGYGRNSYRRQTAGHLLTPGLPSLVLVDLADTPAR